MKVSIVTVSYNSSKTISDTFDSVLAQRYDNIEYIVVDGCSTDGTLDIIKDYVEKFEGTTKSFKWVSEKDKGIYDAINKGIVMATGDVVGILNSDDYYYDTTAVEEIVLGFKEDVIDCVYGNLIYIDPQTGQIVRKWTSKEFEKGLFEKSWTPAHPTFYCKRSMYDKYGIYKIDYEIAADVELMYRFLEKKKLKSKYIDKNLVKMRYGGVSSRGLSSTIIITKELMKAFRENGDHLNLVKYLIYKGMKLKEYMVK